MEDAAHASDVEDADRNAASWLGRFSFCTFLFLAFF